MNFKDKVKFYLNESGKKISETLLDKGRKCVINTETGKNIKDNKYYSDIEVPSGLPSGISNLTGEVPFDVRTDAENYANAICVHILDKKKRTAAETRATAKYIKAFRSNNPERELRALKKEATCAIKAAKASK